MVMQAVGVPMLALGYAATVALLVVDGRRLHHACSRRSAAWR